MKIIQAGRQVGKTTMLTRAMAFDPENSVMVCTDATAAENAFELYRRQGGEVLTQDNFVSGFHPQVRNLCSSKKVFIDNLDLLLRLQFGHVIAASTTETIETNRARPTVAEHTRIARWLREPLVNALGWTR